MLDERHDAALKRGLRTGEIERAPGDRQRDRGSREGGITPPDDDHSLPISGRQF